MDDRLKQRLVGAMVLVVAAVVFVPMLFDTRDEASASRGHTMVSPASPPAVEPQDASARVIPLEGAATGGGDSDGAHASDAAAPRQAPAAEPPVAASARTASTQAAKNSGFAVQLGSFSKEGNARGLRDRLVAKGYSAYMETTDSVTRVYVGPQLSRAEAERVLEKLLADTKLKGIVVEPSG